MKRVLIISFFNSTNIGDKAIGDVLREKIEAFADVDVMDISGRPIWADEKKSDDMPKGVIVPKCRFYTLKSIIALRKPDRMDYAKAMIKKSDVVLLAGGNMIMEHERFLYYSYLCDFYVRYAKRNGKKVLFAFVGVGKYRTLAQQKRWKRAIMNADMVSVRDSLSKEKLSKEMKCHCDISIWKDPAFLVEKIKENKRTGTVGINIYAGFTKDMAEKEKLIASYVFFVEELRQSYNVVLYSTEVKDESDLQRVYEGIQNKEGIEICCPRNLKELLEVYKRLDFVLTTRMHAFVLALSQVIPFVSLAWDRKIKGVVKDIGLSESVYDVRKVYEEKETIVQVVQSKMENYQECLEDTEKKSDCAKKDCFASFEQLRTLIEG